MLNQLTIDIARKIAAGQKFDLDLFVEKHQYNHYLILNHYNFIYSYPEFGNKFINSNESCIYHKIEVCCSECGSIPERNYAGVGSIAIVGFAPYVDGRLKLFCMDCKPGFNFNTDPRVFNNGKTEKQLTLF